MIRDEAAKQLANQIHVLLASPYTGVTVDMLATVISNAVSADERSQQAQIREMATIRREAKGEA